MKIISEFKDFYDYKVGEYGMDSTLVFDRRDPVLLFKESLSTKNVFENPNDTDALHSALYVGNELVHIFSTLNDVYTHFDLENLEDMGDFANNMRGVSDFKLKSGKTITLNSYLYSDEDSLLTQTQQPRSKNIYNIKDIVTPSGHKLQWEDFSQKPLLLIQNRRWDSFPTVDANPFLAQVGIFIDADFIWQSIVQFLSDLKSQSEKSPEVPNNQKIENKGFDKKTSFRLKMKE